MAITSLRVEIAAAMAPLLRSMESLAAATSEAESDAIIDLEIARDGLRFRGELIAAISWSLGVPVSTMKLRVVPTFRMPMFAAEIVRLVPGLRVWWVDGWPHFRAPGEALDDEDDPAPTRPDVMPVPA